MTGVGNIIVGAILILIVALIIRSMVKDHEAGKSVICGDDCSVCGGVCPYSTLSEEELLKKIKEGVDND